MYLIMQEIHSVEFVALNKYKIFNCIYLFTGFEKLIGFDVAIDSIFNFIIIQLTNKVSSILKNIIIFLKLRFTSYLELVFNLSTKS